MSEAARTPAMSYAEYLELEERSEQRHEFVQGELWAMTGGTYNHGLITSNLSAVLYNALRSRPCRVVSESVRVFFPTLGESAYPDLRVICGGPEHHPDDRLAVVNPVLVAEVLSDGTEALQHSPELTPCRSPELTPLSERLHVCVTARLGGQNDKRPPSPSGGGAALPDRWSVGLYAFGLRSDGPSILTVVHRCLSRSSRAPTISFWPRNPYQSS